MSGISALAQRFSGIAGTFAFAALAFLAATALNEFHPFRFSPSDLIAGAVYALFAVAIMQVAARTRRPLQSYLMCAIGAAFLFWLTCWTPIFENSAGRYSPTIALMMWGGITLGVLVWVIYWEKTEPRKLNG